MNYFGVCNWQHFIAQKVSSFPRSFLPSWVSTSLFFLLLKAKNNMYWYVPENMPVLVVQGTVHRGQTCIFIFLLHFICFTFVCWALLYGWSIQRPREQGLAGKGSYCAERLTSRQSGTKGSISRMDAWELAFACFLSWRLLFVGGFSQNTDVSSTGVASSCAQYWQTFFFFFFLMVWLLWATHRNLLSLSVEEPVPRDLCHFKKLWKPFLRRP